MKILVFAEVYYPNVMGGGEFSTKQMAEGLCKRGHEVVVYCLGSKESEEEIKGVRVKRRYIKGASEHFLSLCKNNLIPDPFTRFSKIVRKWGDLYPDRKSYEEYRKIIMRERPDAVHTVSPMSYLGRFNLWKAAYDLKIPVSHVCRAPALLELDFLKGRLDGYNRRRNAAASSFLAALAAPSRYMLKAHNIAGIRGRSFNEIIYNAVDMKPVPVTEDLASQKDNMVLYAGELSEKKGIRTLIEAMEGLEGVRLLLIGRGDLEAELKRDGRAELIGWMEREELFGYMKKAKAVILPSKWNEPFGRILIEAICSGTIAIGSDKGGIPEVLDHSEDHIFKSGDADALRRLIKRVMSLSSSEYAEEIGRQQHMASVFSDDIYTDNWERFFLQQMS
ncbi:MAG: glycosyltransferase [Lachnospiraceae bacterium]|nr:glycosyltransferase [Lachnospiraceae bacterium]